MILHNHSLHSFAYHCMWIHWHDLATYTSLHMHSTACHIHHSNYCNHYNSSLASTTTATTGSSYTSQPLLQGNLSHCNCSNIHRQHHMATTACFDSVPTALHPRLASHMTSPHLTSRQLQLRGLSLARQHGWHSDMGGLTWHSD